MRYCGRQPDCCVTPQVCPEGECLAALKSYKKDWLACWSLQQLLINIFCSLLDVAAAIRERIVEKKQRQDGVLHFNISDWTTLTNGSCSSVEILNSSFDHEITGIGVSYVPPAFSSSIGVYDFDSNDKIIIKVWDFTAGIQLGEDLVLSLIKKYDNFHDSGLVIAALHLNHVVGVMLCLEANPGKTITDFPIDLLIYAKPKELHIDPVIPEGLIKIYTDGGDTGSNSDTPKSGYTINGGASLYFIDRDVYVTSDQVTELIIPGSTTSGSFDGFFDLSQLPLLESFTLLSNGVQSVNTTGCTALTQFRIDSSNITSLDLSTNTALEGITLSGNTLLTTLDLSACTPLTTIQCGSNSNLTSVNISGLAFLTFVNFSGCDLSQSEVDEVLAHLVSIGFTGNCALQGNTTPSGAGLADKATLIGLGATVTTD